MVGCCRGKLSTTSKTHTSPSYRASKLKIRRRVGSASALSRRAWLTASSAVNVGTNFETTPTPELAGVCRNHPTSAIMFSFARCRAISRFFGTGKIGLALVMPDQLVDFEHELHRLFTQV